MSSGTLRPQDEELSPVDGKGRRITLHCRVFVPKRESNLVAGYMVPSFGGIVEQIDIDEFWGDYVITVREFDSWRIRSVRPEDCRVQYGKTKASRADTMARSAVNGVRRKTSKRSKRKKGAT